jgi:hypothetical protein
LILQQKCVLRCSKQTANFVKKRYSGLGVWCDEQDKIDSSPKTILELSSNITCVTLKKIPTTVLL